jgi:PAS domain S-box-containing protein
MKTLYRFLSGTLRGRLIISVALVHAVMMALFIADLTGRQRAMLMERQIEETTALSQALATSAAGWIAANDIAGLQELVDAQRRYPEMLFVILADREGRILADSDRSRQGRYLLDLPREARQTVLCRTPALVDVAVPTLIGGRHVGWARVGIGQKAAGRKLAAITRGGVLYALAAILIGSAIAWLMGRRITHRLYTVQETIDAVRSGNRLARSPISGSDEPAVMAREFNSMLDELAERDAELITSEEKYRRLIDTIQEGIWVIDTNAITTFVNPHMAEILGYTPAEMLGKPLFSFMDEQGKLDAIYKIERRKQGIKEQHDFEFNRKDGQRIYTRLETGPIFDDAGRYAGSIAAVSDITESRQAELLLQASEQAFRAVVENSPDVIVRYDREGRRIYVNPEFERVNHLTARQVLGKKPVEVSTELAPMAEVFTKKLMEAMDTGVVTQIDLAWTKEGKPICWFVRVVPEFDKTGTVVSALTIWSDISERKQIEDEIRKLNEELEQRVQARTAELAAKNTELERMNRLFVGRELRMIELKEQIKALEVKTTDK